MKKIYSVCGMCGTRCLTEAYVENGGAVWVQGNPQAATGTALCARGLAAVVLEKDAERPLSPLLRTGKRGENQWREATWDEALDTVAERLRAVRERYGSESVALSHRGGPFTDLYAAFARGLGTPNIYSHSVTCTRNVDRACASVLGLDRGDLVMDYREARHIVLSGRNALEAINLPEVAAITEAKARGCRLTVMDVRTSVSAARADTFFLMRPGTDYAMNLAVLNVLIGEKRYAPHMASRIDGFEDLAAFVRPYTPQWAEGETGIKAERITRLAHELAEAAPRVIWYPGWFTARYADSFATSRTAYLINALLGSIGERGGMPISLSMSEAGARLTPLSALYPAVRTPKADKSGWQAGG
ncbi:molybdopterin-dependent oxidoreductase, partial [uncultured Bilophila sp.]